MIAFFFINISIGNLEIWYFEIFQNNDEFEFFTNLSTKFGNFPKLRRIECEFSYNMFLLEIQKFDIWKFSKRMINQI